MSNKIGNINIDNTAMALVILIILCIGDPDIIDMIIKLLDSISIWVRSL